MKLKKFFSVLFSLTLISGICGQTVSAKSAMGTENKEETIAAYRVTENGLIKISTDELRQLEKNENINIRNNSENKGSSSNIVVPMEGYYEYSTYSQSSYNANYYRSDLNRRVSPVLYNSTSDNATYSISCQASQSYTTSISGSASLTTTEVSSINATIGYSYNASYSGTINTQITVRPGNYGWYEFYPIMKNTVGTVKTYNQYGTLLTTKSVNIYTPKQVTYNGANWLDGVLIAKTSTVHP